MEFICPGCILRMVDKETGEMISIWSYSNITRGENSLMKQIDNDVEPILRSIHFLEIKILPQERTWFTYTISFFTSQPALLDDRSLINQLIDQVYQFSRLYWKSVSQQNLLVTIKYPAMVAEIFPHFTYDKLPDFGKENLWFL